LHLSRERVRQHYGLVDEPQGVRPVGVLVDIGGEDGREQLLGQEGRARVGDLQDGRVDEPAGRVVGGAADDDQAFGPCSGECLGGLACWRALMTAPT
jgi:hypothetical protein